MNRDATAAAVDSMHARHDAIDENRARHDILYRMIMSRDRRDRLAFVGRIRQRLATAFAPELANVADPAFRQTFHAFFAACARDDDAGNMLQLYCVFLAVHFDAEVEAWFRPVPVDPDAPADTPDPSRVDRQAFSVWRQYYVKPYMEPLLDGQSRITVPQYCWQLASMYIALLPPDPVHEQACARTQPHQRPIAYVPVPDTPLTTTLDPE